jgi:predicted signal transduction protein with EAL and GGDEF domain
MIPRLWWFLVPGGIYWWMWHYSEAMAVVTHQRLKASDTFLIYVLSSSAWLVGGSGIGNVFNFQSSTGDPNFHLILIAIVVVVGVLLLLGLAGNTFFMCYMQRKTDGIRKPTSN